jgi:hypothetical protein
LQQEETRKGRRNKGEIIADTLFPTEMGRQKGLDGWMQTHCSSVQVENPSRGMLDAWLCYGCSHATLK